MKQKKTTIYKQWNNYTCQMRSVFRPDTNESFIKCMKVFYTNNQFPKSVKSVGNPTIHVNSKVSETQSHKTVLTSDSGHKYQVPTLPRLLSHLSTKSGVPTTLPRHTYFESDNLLEQLKEPWKTLYICLLFYYEE
jgi:hypothetical protein